MPCTICRVDGCRADVCQSYIIDQQNTVFCTVFAQQVERAIAFRQWSHYQVSDTPTQPGPTSWLYTGWPDMVRRNIVDERKKYLSNKVDVEIKKDVRHITTDWSVGLFKRVFPLFLEYICTSYSLTDVDEFNRLLAEPRLINPHTCTDYRGHASSLAIWLMRKSLPEDFLDLSNIDQRYLRPPTWTARNNSSSRTRVVYRDRIVYKEIRISSKIAMQMCEHDEKYLIDDICPICMDETQANNVVAYTCGHAFCCDCSSESLKKCGRKCPMCRVKTTHIKFKSDILPEKFNILMKLVQ